MTFDPNQQSFPELNKDTLEVIQNYGSALAELDDLIKKHEEELAQAKSNFKDIAEHKLPELMSEIVIDELKLSDGSIISKKEFVYSRIKDPDTCFNWLKEHGEDAIIDNTVVVKFAKGQDREAEILITTMMEQGQNFTNKKDVHWKRLESFIKEALADPELSKSLPKEAFGVYEGELVKFKKPIL